MTAITTSTDARDTFWLHWRDLWEQTSPHLHEDFTHFTLQQFFYQFTQALLPSVPTHNLAQHQEKQRAAWQFWYSHQFAIFTQVFDVLMNPMGRFGIHEIEVFTAAVRMWMVLLDHQHQHPAPTEPAPSDTLPSYAQSWTVPTGDLYTALQLLQYFAQRFFGVSGVSSVSDVSDVSGEHIPTFPILSVHPKDGLFGLYLDLLRVYGEPQITELFAEQPLPFDVMVAFHKNTRGRFLPAHALHRLDIRIFLLGIYECGAPAHLLPCAAQELLADSSPDIRIAALRSVAAAELIPLLVERLHDNNPFVQQAAIEVCAELPDAIPLLLPFLEHSNIYICNQTIKSLGKAVGKLLDKTTRLDLEQDLEQDSELEPELEQEHTQNLELIAHVFATLSAYTRHPNPYTRQTAIEALAPYPQGIAACLGALRELNPYIRNSAITALGKHAPMHPELYNALLPFLDDPNSHLSTAVLAALADPPVISPTDPQHIHTQSRNLVHTLGIQLRTGLPHTRSAALLALAGYADTQKHLIPSLSDANPHIRAAAIQALAKHDRLYQLPNTVDLLLPMLHDSNPLACTAAIRALSAYLYLPQETDTRSVSSVSSVSSAAQLEKPEQQEQPEKQEKQEQQAQEQQEPEHSKNIVSYTYRHIKIYAEIKELFYHRNPYVRLAAVHALLGNLPTQSSKKSYKKPRKLSGKKYFYHYQYKYQQHLAIIQKALPIVRGLLRPDVSDLYTQALSLFSIPALVEHQYAHTWLFPAIFHENPAIRIPTIEAFAKSVNNNNQPLDTYPPVLLFLQPLLETRTFDLCPALAMPPLYPLATLQPLQQEIYNPAHYDPALGILAARMKAELQATNIFLVPQQPPQQTPPREPFAPTEMNLLHPTNAEDAVLQQEIIETLLWVCGQTLQSFPEYSEYSIRPYTYGEYIVIKTPQVCRYVVRIFGTQPDLFRLRAYGASNNVSTLRELTQYLYTNPNHPPVDMIIATLPLPFADFIDHIPPPNPDGLWLGPDFWGVRVGEWEVG